MTKRGMTGSARSIWIGAAVTVLAAVAWYAVFADREGPLLADPSDAELVALGRDVYAAHCASCHGEDLQGQPDWRSRNPDGTLPAPPHDQTGHTWHHPDQILVQITRDGGAAVAPAGFKSAMPGFAGTLDDREIRASIAYIKSRWPAPERQKQDSLTRQSR